MTVRNILVPILPNVAAKTQLDAALQLAVRVGGHVNALYVRPDPASVLAAMPELGLAGGFTLTEIEQEGERAARSAHTSFDRWVVANELASEPFNHLKLNTFARWTEEVALPEMAILRHGRISDMTILNRPFRDHLASRQAVVAAIFDTGRPAIIVPAILPENMLDHIMIAWNGSLEAARAVAGAMRLLHCANRVSIFSSRSPDDDQFAGARLSEALHWHAIDAHCITPDLDGRSMGVTLLQAAEEQKVSMLVMGAYTHSRIREMVLGGVTRHVLGHAEIPVLMTH